MLWTTRFTTVRTFYLEIQIATDINVTLTRPPYVLHKCANCINAPLLIAVIQHPPLVGRALPIALLVIKNSRIYATAELSRGTAVR